MENKNLLCAEEKGCEQVKIRTKFGIAMQMACILCLAGTTMFLLIGWNRIPAEVPGHYNGAGEVDSMTGKGSLILLHVINCLMFLGISALECFPQIWNVGVKVTARNRERVYRIVYHMVVSTKLSMVLIFSFITVWPVSGADFPIWFTPISLVLPFGLIAIFGIQLWRAR